MKRTLDLLFVTASLAFLFWPWLMMLSDGLRWFFHAPMAFDWDRDRLAMAALYPIPAFFVWAFLLWAYEQK
jgi:hypothetical protein